MFRPSCRVCGTSTDGKVRETGAGDHVRVEQVRTPPEDDWHLTGAVTFHESDVRIESSAFTGNQAEDALNVIRGAVEIRGSSFLASAGDAVDLDFGQGIISTSTFEDTGGDALDISASKLRVSDTRFRRVKDKAISVGEGSTLIGSRLSIDEAFIAIASKDASTATLIDSRIENIEGVAFAAFIKKPEYGPSELIVVDTELRNATLDVAAAPSCSVTIDGVAARAAALDLGRLYAAGTTRSWEPSGNREP